MNNSTFYFHISIYHYMNRIVILMIFILGMNSACKNDNTNNSNENQQEQVEEIEFNILKKDAKIALKEFESASTFPYFIDGKWGYSNNKGEIIIEPLFEKCSFFNEGFAWIMYQNKYGIIDSDGKIVVDFIYDQVGKKYREMIPVKQNNLWGIIDSDGNQLLPFQYEELVFQDDSTIHVRQNQQWGIIDYKGKQICLPIYDHNFKFLDKLAIVTRNYKRGIIRKDGKQLIECNYSSIKILNDTLFISGNRKSYDNYIYGLHTIEGKTILPIEYQKIENVIDETFILKKDNRTGLVKLSGDTIIDFIYDDLKSGNTNILLAQSNSKWGYVSMDNDTLIDFKYDNAKPFHDSIAIVEDGRRFGVINIKNEMIIPIGSYEIEILNSNLIKIRNSWNDYLFFNSQGKQLLSSFDMQDYHAEEDYTGSVDNEMEFGVFHNGFAIVGNKGRVGMINEQGEIVVPMQYHYLEPMNEYGYTIASFWDKYGIIDRKGKQVTPIVYEQIAFDEDSKYFYALKNFPYKSSRREYYYDDFKPIGYLGYNGIFYGEANYIDPEPFVLENYILKIRESFKRIEKEASDYNYKQIEFGEYSILGKYSNSKFIVEDHINHTKYQYYYDSTLNRHGPFFIFTIHNNSKKENRYYYSHGKIIRWIDEDGEYRPVGDALFAPEDPSHHLARKHKVEFHNQLLIDKKSYKDKMSNIDIVCNRIENDIKVGKYKKGDSNHHSSGEYQENIETYLDQSGDLIYKKYSVSDETGGNKTLDFYSKGNPLRFYSNGNYIKQSDIQFDPGWLCGQYSTTEYYVDGNLLCVLREKNGIVEIVEPEN